MKLLRCILCSGEIDIIDSSSVNQKVKCKSCGFTNVQQTAGKAPEIFVIRKRTTEE